MTLHYQGLEALVSEQLFLVDPGICRESEAHWTPPDERESILIFFKSSKRRIVTYLIFHVPFMTLLKLLMDHHLQLLQLS